MIGESAHIMIRRFTARITESGLLIVLIALGVGAAASGVSIMISSAQYAQELEASHEYHEITVSITEDADTMDLPVQEKSLEDVPTLTTAELSAQELIPMISYAYIASDARLQFINDGAAGFGPGMQSREDADAEESQQSTEMQERFAQMQQEQNEMLQEAQGNDQIIIAGIDELSELEISEEYFTARDLQPMYGSLFSEYDYADTSLVTVLGYDAAELLIDEESGGIADIIGKQLLTREGYLTVIGVLEETGDPSTDAKAYAPYRDGGYEFLRFKSMNTSLIFYTGSIEDLDTAATLLEQWFDSEYGEGQVVIDNPRSEAQQLTSRNRNIGILLLLLSCAGLFIAAVNVSHMLLSRIMRMKHHVGILMALGASKYRVKKMFIEESLAITFAGSLLGMVFAIPLNGAMQEALEIEAAMWGPVMIGVVASVLLILMICILPIIRYTTIEPAEAMRV